MISNSPDHSLGLRIGQQVLEDSDVTDNSESQEHSLLVTRQPTNSVFVTTVIQSVLFAGTNLTQKARAALLHNFSGTDKFLKLKSK
jgi:hypothetical protein